jgi:Methylamine utilisation protein MauE
VIQDVVQVAVAVVLLVAAAAKLARPADAIAGLATWRLGHPAVLGALVATEAGIAVTLLLGLPVAPWLAAGLFLLFAAALAWALRTGRAGAPCGCLGARSTVSNAALGRALALAAVAVAIPFLPDETGTTEAWLGLGLAVALVGVAALGVAVAALAREVGRLRVALGPDPALEIPHEGPAVGANLPELGGRFSPGTKARLALAVFESEGCRMCRTLSPTIDGFAREPVLAVERFDEVRDADVWRALEIPGSPFAVVLSLDGTVLSKGTFNTPAQLEGLLATAERRDREEEVLHG